MRKITVAGNDEYQILIQSGILGSCGEYIREVTLASRALIISDTNVFPLYGQTVAASLEQNGFKVFSHVFPAGEASKNLSTVEEMIKALCQNELSRNDIVIALGGGVTGDMAGFASAIYLRGINFVQIPTSLLAMVDSSVGGKTGCDLSFGKNLIGAFHNPSLVLIDPETIKTLPDRYKNDGVGEIIKYAFIKSEELYNTLTSCKSINDVLTDVIYTCVDIKRQVVENDFTEKGERMLLNFGHTLAHAIEKYENFSGLAHGEAVGVGMLKITKAAERADLAQKGTAQKIETLLNKFSLPTTFNGQTEELVNIMLYDKKRRGNSINLVICEREGSSFVKAFLISGLQEFFAEE